MRRLLYIFVLLLILTGTGTVGIHWLSGKSWIESAYLAIITLATVGSVDVGQDDPRRMLFVIVFLVCGLGAFTYSAYQLGQLLVDAQLRNLWETRRMHRQIDSLQGHFLICGLGRMGRAIAEHLAARKRPFVVIDRDADRLQQVCAGKGWLNVHGDATADDVLVQAGIRRARALATVLPTDADNVYVVLSARLLSAGLQIIARASGDAAMKKLQRAGATRVVSPYSSGAVKIARFMLNPSIEDFLEVADEHGSDLELADLQITAGSPYVGRKLADTDLRDKGIMVIGIRRTSGERLLPPHGSDVIQAGDSLFAFGSSAAVNAMISEQDRSG
jgi:voltage-gated potassium channel